MTCEDPDYRFVCGNCRQWRSDNEESADQLGWGKCTAEIPIWLDSLLVVEYCLDYKEYVEKSRLCVYTDPQAEFCDRFSPNPPPPTDMSKNNV